MEQESDSRSSKARTFVICAALSVLILPLIGVVFRQDLETQYHLYRIQKDIQHALTLIAQPEGTPERRAIRRHIAESFDFHGKLTPAEPPDARLDIVAGKIRAKMICHFLTEWTGLATIMDRDLAGTEFAIPHGIDALDAELVGLLLALQGCSLTVKTLPNERQVVRMQSTSPSDGPSILPLALQRQRWMALQRLGYRNRGIAWFTHVPDGIVKLSTLAHWIDLKLDGSVSVDPAIQETGIVVVAARIQNADAFVLQELVSANGYILESRDDNDLRIRARPRVKD